MNSQYLPGQERRPASPSRNPLPTNSFPRGLRLMRPNGTFYPFEGNANLVGTSDGYIIGIRDASGILRPFFFHRMMVKFKSEESRRNRVVPLTLREYRHYNYNSDITTSTDRFVQYIREFNRSK